MKSSVSRERSINSSKSRKSINNLSNLSKSNNFNLKKYQSLGKSNDKFQKMKKTSFKSDREVISPKTIEYSKS